MKTYEVYFTTSCTVEVEDDVDEQTVINKAYAEIRSSEVHLAFEDIMEIEF